MKKMLILWLAASCTVAMSQAQAVSDSIGTLTIITSPPGADVYFDSLFVGKSPVQNLQVPLGRHAVKSFYPSVFSWDPLVATDSLTITQGQNPEKRIALGTLLRVQTSPAGSKVAVGGAIVGTTPLTLRSPEVARESLVIMKSGYDTLTVPMDTANGNFLRVRLTPVAGLSGEVPPGERQSTLLNADHWLTYTSTATMIGSGVLSAYLKDRANREFNKYLSTRDPGSLSTTRRLDRGAAAALVVSQISFVVLAAILLSE
jgi:hypothetical protein